MSPSPRTAALVLVAVALLGSGCSYNPGYFPYLVPGGPIAEMHAKPGGHGYFRNFDPKACKLEVTPNQQITAPVGTQVVLVGSVLDKDGQPRRSRRIEWIVDGPGNIVEADESGFYFGRGYKVDNKYAVTHTNYTTRTVTRGNTDAGDDVCINPGQTFCVLSSAVPGETTVTAYAPAVFNWDNGRVVVKICWGDGRFRFPEPAVVRFGGEHTLTTVVSATASEGGVPSGYRIRYKVLDGPPAVLVSRGGSGTGASQSGPGGAEAEAFTDADGAAAVRLVQNSPKPGKSRVAVEIVKPPEAGTGPGTVVARRETVIEWAEPKLGLTVTAPPAAGVNGTFPVTVALDNAAGVDSQAARVKVALSDGATLDRSEPPPVRQDGRTLVFELPPVPGNGKQEVTLHVTPKRLGEVVVNAEVATADGLQASKSATTRVEQGRLQVLVEAPAVALAGEQIPFRVAVTNAGAAPAEHVTVWARIDDGLKHSSGEKEVELSAATLAPGQTKLLDLPLTAKAAGRFGVRALATADGELKAESAPVAVDVRRVELAAAASGPKLAYLNQEFAWTVTVANKGDAAVSGAVVRAAVPPEVRVKPAGDGGRAGPGSVEWLVGELRPGDQKTFRVTAEATKLTDRATLNVSVSADATSGGRPVGEPVGAKAESTVAIIGTPAVVLELATPPGLVDVGKRVAFQVRVKNQGTLSARNVEVTAQVPPELKALRGSGAGEGRIDAKGTVAFPPVDEVRPGQTVTFTIDVEAVRAGDARFRAEVKAAHLTTPLKEEQSTRVLAK